ncbi:MAG: hypothetical protein PCFJNLEI_04140 [Verrucomicrobiae bacterium]|nr:hypothetical protein [Verrucomicrobiae bacterium]
MTLLKAYVIVPPPLTLLAAKVRVVASAVKSKLAFVNGAAVTPLARKLVIVEEDITCRMPIDETGVPFRLTL